MVVPAFFRPIRPSVHGGVDAQALQCQGVAPETVIDFSANQSPLGPSRHVAAAMAHARVEQYPDRDALPLRQAIAAYHRLTPAHIVAGNGSTELIRLIAQLALQPGEIALACRPTFGEYAVATQLAGGELTEYALLPGHGIDIAHFLEALEQHAPKLCWLCSPNYPTGVALAPAAIAMLVSRAPHTLFVLDEAYCDLLPAAQWTPALLAHGNLIVLRSMTKAWGLAGLRLGYALGSPALIEALLAAMPPWNVNACAQVAGIAALADREHYRQTVMLLRQETSVLQHGLQTQGWETFPSEAAFFLVRVDDAATVQHVLLQQGCLVRDCTSFGLPEYIRISPRHHEQNRRLLDAFACLRQTEVVR